MARENERHIVVSPKTRDTIEKVKEYLESECGFYSVTLKEASDFIVKKSDIGFMTKQEIKKLFSSIRSYGGFT